jgi:hypothetical protein
MAGKNIRSFSSRPTTPATKDQIGLGKPSAGKHFSSDTARGPKGVMPITPGGPRGAMPGAPPGQSPDTPDRTGGNTLAIGKQASKAHGMRPAARPVAVNNRRTEGPPSPAYGGMVKR